MTLVMDAPTEAQFQKRSQCITCGSADLKVLSSGRFSEGVVHQALTDDPFGEDPRPALRNATWTFVQCTTCDQKFHRDILNDEWLGVFYNRWITSDAIEQFYASRGGAGFEHDFEVGKHGVERALLLERLTRPIRGDGPVRVLDFGCGEGVFLSACATFGFEGVGVEFSEAREAKKRVTFYADLDGVGRAHTPGSFHAITLFEVLEHLADPLSVLQQLAPFLKPGGILVLETPNCEGVTDIRTRSDYDLISPLGHVNGFTPATQERIAQEAGFTRIAPGVVQCTADVKRVYKREARRFLQPLLKRYTQQVFVKDG